jgi:hypothetical protein
MTGPSPFAKPAGASSHARHAQHHAKRQLSDAIARTLSYDLPEPPRDEAAVRASVHGLSPHANDASLNEEGLPVPEPFKVKMVEQIK